jgi:hypothetical protein
MGETPEFATHYYMTDRQPFLNLSDVEPARLSGVMSELNSLAALAGPSAGSGRGT